MLELIGRVHERVWPEQVENFMGTATLKGDEK